MRTSVCRLAFMLGLVVAFESSADVISLDDAVFGADALTVDTEQGLEFLDLNWSTSRTVNMIMSEFGVGGDFEGFRRASGEEVLTMISNAGFDIPALGSGITIPPSTAFRDFVNMTGVVGGIGGIRFSRGLVTDAPAPGRSYFVALEDFTGVNQHDIITSEISAGNNESSGSIGHWLVRDVPAPGALSLLGMCGLVGMRARR